AGGRAFEATLVVGADGRNSVVRHRAGLDAPVGRKRFALVCRATGVAPGSRGLSRGMRHGEMHVSPLGQVGVAPLSDGAVNLNLLLSESGRALLKLRTPEHLMRAALAGTPSLRARTRWVRLGTVLATGSLPQGSRAVAADGVALVGDAAGFWDPFTGDGMCIALRGAELLARTVSALDFTKAIPENALEPYVRDWRRALALKRMISPILHHALARRRLGVAMVSALSRSRWLGRLMVAIEGGRPI
ncbi:MAG: FAD-dependent monooxygenase, partial [Planctomycetes bacterium]|nr:FAD-dependent monooxygenase [Planctomycetota bacterium]